jgi:hypothetical protein
LENATEILNQCLQDPDQKPAWGCTSGAIMNLEIKIVDSDPVIRFSYDDPSGAYDELLSNVRFGAQPPIMDDFTSMSLMKARDHLDKGPAYVFHKQFDKLVILPEDTFQAPAARRRRRDDGSSGVHYPPSTNFTPAAYAPIGHKPWYCYWNRTLLEGFIFVNTDVAITGNASITPAGSATVEIAVTPPSSPSGTVETSVTPSSVPTHTVELSIAPSSFSNIVTTTSSLFDPIFEYSLTQSSTDFLSSTPVPAPPHLPPTESTDEASGHVKSRSLSSRQGGATSEANDDSVDTTMNTFPKMIKIEERRNFETEVQPYCQQMLIMEDLTVRDIGMPRIDLGVDEAAEVQPSQLKTRRGLPSVLSGLKKRGAKSACWCEWIIDGTYEDV